MTDVLTEVKDLVGKAKLLDPKEIKGKIHLTEGEWEDRMTAFLNDPTNRIPNVGIVRDCTRAVLTDRYAKHLAKATIVKHTKLLERWER